MQIHFRGYLFSQDKIEKKYYTQPIFSQLIYTITNAKSFRSIVT